MGQKSRAGMWCDYCDRPIAGQKATHRARNTIGALFAPASSGASLLFARVESYHCPICGQPARQATREDFARAQSGIASRVDEPTPSTDEGSPPRHTERKSPDDRKRELRYLVDSHPNKAYRVGLNGLIETFARGKPDSPRTHAIIAAELKSAGLAIREDLPTDESTVTLCLAPPDERSRDDSCSPESKQSPLPAHVLEQLEELAEFRAKGALSEAEYEAVKARLVENARSREPRSADA